MGSLLLPPNATGLVRTSTTLSLSMGLGKIAHRRDRVYVTTDRDLARVWAGQWSTPEQLGYGWLYRVSVPPDEIEPDEDLLSLPGLSFQVPSARVEAIYEKAVAPNQPRFKTKLEKVIGDLEHSKRTN